MSEVQPLLSFVVCTRNDDYMVNPMWRLQTCLNFLGKQVASIGRAAEVEVVVADWGSTVPVHEMLQLTPDAARITRFLVMPPDLAAAHNRDSPFAEVFPINAAVRRARGRYIGRIDQDTLITAPFLRNFFDRFGGTTSGEESGLMFSARKQVPFSYVKHERSLAEIEQCIEVWGSLAIPEEARTFYASPVGVILASRDIWHAARGYDERLIYYWYMDLDFAKRVALEQPLRNIGEEFGYDIFHLEHFPLWRWRGTHRKLNPETVRLQTPVGMQVNSVNWGLGDADIPTIQVAGKAAATVGLPSSHYRLWHSGAWLLLHRLRTLGAHLLRWLKPR